MDPLIPNVPLRPRRFRGGHLLVCGLATTALALAVSCISPPLYRSSAKFTILRDPASEGPKWLRDPNTLRRAGLNASRLTVQPVPGTPDVEISVLDEDPHRAAQLANALAAAYQETRSQLDAASHPERLAALEATMASVSAAYETAKHEHEAVSRSLEAARARFGESPEGPWRRQGEVDASIEDQKLLTTQLDELRNSPFPDFLQVANRHKLINSDRMVWVAEYFGTISTLQAQQQAGLPATHPEVLRTKTQANALRVQLEKDAEDLTASMALKIDALKQRMESLEAQKTAERAVLAEALAAFQVADGVYRTALGKLREARIHVEAERAAAAAKPAYIAIAQPAEPQRRAAQPAFWLPLLLSPVAGLAGGLLLQWLRAPRHRQGDPVIA